MGSAATAVTAAAAGSAAAAPVATGWAVGARGVEASAAPGSEAAGSEVVVGPQPNPVVSAEEASVTAAEVVEVPDSAGSAVVACRPEAAVATSRPAVGAR